MSSIGWNDIAFGIRKMRDELNYSTPGLILCGYAINYTYRISNIKLASTTLDQGTECIKQLNEVKISSLTKLSNADKAIAIQWYNEFMDIWKTQMANALRQEGLLIG